MYDETVNLVKVCEGLERAAFLYISVGERDTVMKN
jgi:hypothetical protein